MVISGRFTSNAIRVFKETKKTKRSVEKHTSNCAYLPIETIVHQPIVPIRQTTYVTPGTGLHLQELLDACLQPTERCPTWCAIYIDHRRHFVYGSTLSCPYPPDWCLKSVSFHIAYTGSVIRLSAFTWSLILFLKISYSLRPALTGVLSEQILCFVEWFLYELCECSVANTFCTWWCFACVYLYVVK